MGIRSPHLWAVEWMGTGRYPLSALCRPSLNHQFSALAQKEAEQNICTSVQTSYQTRSTCILHRLCTAACQDSCAPNKCDPYKHNMPTTLSAAADRQAKKWQSTSVEIHCSGRRLPNRNVVDVTQRCEIRAAKTRGRRVAGREVSGGTECHRSSVENGWGRDSQGVGGYVGQPTSMEMLPQNKTKDATVAALSTESRPSVASTN